MKILEGRLTLLFNDEGMIIEIEDRKSGEPIVHVKVDSQETLQSLSRVSRVKCELTVPDYKDLKKIGKKLIIDKLEFPMPDCGYGERQDLAKIEVLSHIPKGWEPDLYFGSQDSFFRKEDGTEWARTTIRKWE